MNDYTPSRETPQTPRTPVQASTPSPHMLKAPTSAQSSRTIEVFSTPPSVPAQHGGWLDPNLPTPPTYKQPSRPASPHDEDDDLAVDESPVARDVNTGDGIKGTAREGVEMGAVSPTEALLSRVDITADPILAQLASSQGLITQPHPTPIYSNRPTPAHPPPAARRFMAGANDKNDKEGTRKEGKDTGFVFKARPAPNMRPSTGIGAPEGKEGRVGPRLSKAAALRMGVWEPNERDREKERLRAGKGDEKEGMEARKAKRQSVVIASLATPVVQPKQNRTAQLRSGAPPTTPAAPTRRLKTAEEVAADKQARLKEEKEKRRQSVVLPPSFSTPSITPRMNRSAALRTGTALPPISAPRGLTATASAAAAAAADARGMPPPALPVSRTTSRLSSALTATTADNARTQSRGAAAGGGTMGKGNTGIERDGKLRRTSTVGAVKSLGAPSIVPRLNRTAMLRTAPRFSTSAGQTTSTLPSLSHPGTPGRSRASSVADLSSRRPPASVSSTGASTRVSGVGARPTTAAPSTGSSGVGKAPAVVRQTKASILRAAAFAKAKAAGA